MGFNKDAALKSIGAAKTTPEVPVVATGWNRAKAEQSVTSQYSSVTPKIEQAVAKTYPEAIPERQAPESFFQKYTTWSEKTGKEIGKGGATFLSGLIGDATTKDIPYAGAAASGIELYAVKSAADKFRETGDEASRILVEQYFDEQEQKKKKRENILYEVGEGVRNSATFGVELIMSTGLTLGSGGTGAASFAAPIARKTTIKAAEKHLEELLADKVFREAVQTGMKSYGLQLGKQAVTIGAPVIGAHIPTGSIERMIGDPAYNEKGVLESISKGQDMPEAVMNAISENVVMVASEFTGGIYNLMGKASKNVLARTGIIKAVQENLKTTPSTAAKVIEKLGWHGVFGEMGEELNENVINAVLESLGLGDREWQPITPRSLAVTMLTIGGLGTGVRMTQAAFDKIEKRRRDAALEIAEEKRIDQQVEVKKEVEQSGLGQSIRSAIETNGEEEVKQQLIVQYGITESDASRVVQIAVAPEQKTPEQIARELQTIRDEVAASAEIQQKSTDEIISRTEELVNQVKDASEQEIAELEDELKELQKIAQELEKRPEPEAEVAKEAILLLPAPKSMKLLGVPKDVEKGDTVKIETKATGVKREAEVVEVREDGVVATVKGDSNFPEVPMLYRTEKFTAIPHVPKEGTPTYSEWKKREADKRARRAQEQVEKVFEYKEKAKKAKKTPAIAAVFERKVEEVEGKKPAKKEKKIFIDTTPDKIVSVKEKQTEDIDGYRLDVRKTIKAQIENGQAISVNVGLLAKKYNIPTGSSELMEILDEEKTANSGLTTGQKKFIAEISKEFPVGLPLYHITNYGKEILKDGFQANARKYGDDIFFSLGEENPGRADGGMTIKVMLPPNMYHRVYLDPGTYEGADTEEGESDAFESVAKNGILKADVVLSADEIEKEWISAADSSIAKKNTRSLSEKRSIRTLVSLLHKDAFGGNEKNYQALVKEAKAVGLDVDAGESEGSTLYIPYAKRASMSMKEAGDLFASIINEKAKITGASYHITPNSDGSITAFHGTKKSSAESILENGFDAQAYLSPEEGTEAGGVAGASEYAGKDGAVFSVTFDPRYMELNGLGEIKIESEYIISSKIEEWTSKQSVQDVGRKLPEPSTTKKTPEPTVTSVLKKKAQSEEKLKVLGGVDGTAIIYKKTGEDEGGDMYEPFMDHKFDSLDQADAYLEKLLESDTLTDDEAYDMAYAEWRTEQEKGKEAYELYQYHSTLDFALKETSQDTKEIKEMQRNVLDMYRNQTGTVENRVALMLDILRKRKAELLKSDAKVDKSPFDVKDSTEALARLKASLEKPDTSGMTVRQIDEANEKAFFESHNANIERLRTGNITPEELKAAFGIAVARQEDIMGWLNKLTIAELRKKFGGYPRPGEKKADVVKSSYQNILELYAPTEMLSWHAMSETYSEAVARYVNSATPESISEYSKAYQERKKAREERLKEVIQAIKDPQTLDQFRTFIEANGAEKMTDEQRIRYDELVAEKIKTDTEKKIQQKALVKGVNAGVGFEVHQTKHTKTGADLFVVTMGARVEKDVYSQLNSAAKRLGGYYSSFRGAGAIPGFQFKTAEDAQTFMKAGQGENVDAGSKMEARAEEQKAKTTNKLAQIAEQLEERATEKLNQDRKTNTAKRAREASGAESDARKDIQMAQTMKNLAGAIATGRAKFLDGITAKTHIEQIENILHRAKYRELNRKYPDYGDRLKHEGEPVTDETISELSVEDIFYPSKGERWQKDVIEPNLNKPGMKLLARRFQKLIPQGEKEYRPGNPEAADGLYQLMNSANVPDHSPMRLSMESYRRLRTMGVVSLPQMRAMFREYVTFRGDAVEADKAKELERALVGAKVGFDFFPTPRAVADQMVMEAGIKPGMKVLEPSAGNGNIAGAIKDAGVNPDVIELSSQLREILEAKGYNVIGQDFLQHTEGGYDAIIQNPPFSNNQDIAHVRHAYDLLAPGGKLVSIVGEGAFFRSGKTETEFRDWLDVVGATVEQLPAGTFEDKTLMATTGANGRMVVIEKPVVSFMTRDDSGRFATEEQIQDIEQMKSDTITVDVEDIARDEDLDEAVSDVLEGKKSMTDLPMLLKADVQEDGSVIYTIIDGRHRLAEAIQSGATKVKATLNEALYNKISNEREVKFSLQDFAEEAASGPVADSDEGRKVLAEIKDRMKYDLNVVFADNIFTGGFDKAVYAMTGDKEAVEAYGATLGRDIVVTKDAPLRVLPHEMLGHFTIQNLDQMEPEFGMSRVELLTAYNNGKTPSTPKQEQKIEESIVHDFESVWEANQRGEGHTFAGVVGRFFDRLVAYIKQILDIPLTDREIIRQFYDKLLYMRRRGPVISDQSYNLDRFETAPGVYNFGVNAPYMVKEDPLIAEARKYKTAEEFVKAHGTPVYHGTGEGVSFSVFDSSKTQEGNRGKQIYLTENKIAADWFSRLKSQSNFMKTDAFRKDFTSGAIGDFKPNTLEFVIPKGAKIKVLDTLPQNSAEKVIAQLKKQGFDGVRFTDDVLNTIEGQTGLNKAFVNGKHPDTTIVFNTDILNTRSQLTDIWKKAQETPSFMRKDPTIEEFDAMSEDEQREIIAQEAMDDISGYGVLSPEQQLADDLLTGKVKASLRTDIKKDIRETMGKALYMRVFSKKGVQSWDELTQLVRDTTGDATFDGNDLVDVVMARNAARQVASAEQKERRTIAREARRSEIAKAKTDKEKADVIRSIERDITRKILMKRWTTKQYVAAIERGQKQGYKQGVRSQKDRSKRVNAVAEVLGLSDSDVVNILHGRNFRIMTDKAFEEFVLELEMRGQIVAEHKEAMIQLMGTMWDLELRRVENLQKALELPRNFSEFTTQQLREFEALVSKYEHGDEFLSARVLETIDLTDMKGVKTRREVLNKLAEEAGGPIGEVKVYQSDKMRWDVALASRNPLYKVMVEGWSKALMNGDARFLKVERVTQVLMKEARKSRIKEMTLGGRIRSAFVPTDTMIFDWLEGDLEQKENLAKVMTREEMAAALYIQEQYARMRDYLVMNKQLDKFRENYITHIRRGFLEAWSGDTLKQATKELLDQYKMDEAVFTILDQKTGEILPLEKFFQYSLQRTGGLVPTKNVSKAFLAYAKSFERKAAMDSVIPKLYSFARVFTREEETTAKGVVLNDSLERFVKEWINAKKGRAEFGIAQGSRLDAALRMIDSFTILHDLGLNIPVGVSAQFGEQTTTFINIGAKRYGLGISRLRTKKGMEITKKYEHFVGRTPFDSLMDTDRGVGEKMYDGLFFLFQSATVRANKVHLLGSLTKEEWANGEISAERLADIRLEMGRYRVIEGGESIWGKTTIGGIVKRYKAWAVAPATTVIKNLETMGKMIKNGDANKIITSREFQETIRATIVIALVTLIAASYDDDPKDKSSTAQLIRKAIRDSYTIIQSLDPKVWGSVRMLSFIEDLSTAMSDLVKMVEYSEKGEKRGQLKGDDELIRVLLPVTLQ